MQRHAYTRVSQDAATMWPTCELPRPCSFCSIVARDRDRQLGGRNKRLPVLLHRKAYIELLPPLQELEQPSCPIPRPLPDSAKPSLVLDLDETLVHSR